ncbi:MAG: tRNA pseudouridine synthase A, partial [Clostridia bacterium]|nr:tRNA pseudouridine synthase A [Clostridia bacterium]
EKLPFALNAHLPPSVVVRRTISVPDDFDARFSCKKKEYTYIIDNGAFPDPLKLGYASYVKRRLDTERMAAGAAYLLGEHDFSAFRCEGSNVKTTVRTLYTCGVSQDGDVIRIKTSADGFLYNMVRNIAGTLIYVGLSKFEPRDVERILFSCDRKEAGPCAPPQGLYMTALYYGTEGLDGGKSV